MKNKNKALAVVLSTAMLVAASVFTTLAYLTDTAQAVNTFTVGKVEITITEPNWDKEKEHKLVPGAVLPKDPTVTVEADSEVSYIRMFVTVSHMKELDEIFARTKVQLMKIFGGYQSDRWTLMTDTIPNDADNTRTYEFRYYDTVSAPDADVKLEPLFTSVVVPGEFTNQDLDDIKDLTITVKAEAIQALGFDDADAAWDAFEAQNN